MVSQLMPLIGGFIGLVIILGVGTLILGNSTMDCTTLAGFVDGGTASTTNSTGWAYQCISNNSNAQSGYALLIIAIIVFAAVIILSIVRLLG
jgi:hypothetical protein